jgi:LacI family transcriptional regulator
MTTIKSNSRKRLKETLPNESSGANRRPVTVSQIAKDTGLASSTVSLILNGHGPRLKIAPATLKRVFDMAREKKYVPNELARSLRAQRTFVIGAVFGNLYNGWAQKVLEGMLEVFDDQGYSPFMTIHNWDAEREAREVNSMLQRRVDGIVCIPIEGGFKTYRDVQQRGIPIVLLGDTFKGLEDFSYVSWNSGRAAKVIVEHLIAIGRKKIGYMGAELNNKGTLERLAAYKAALGAHGLPFRKEWVAMHPTIPSATTMARVMLDQLFAPGGEHPDALYVLNDGLALPALGLLEERGIRVPEDVAIAGMGNMPGVSHPLIGLTTVAEPLAEMGRLTAKTILSLVENPSQPPIKQLVESSTLLPRTSTVGRHAPQAGKPDWQMG